MTACLCCREDSVTEILSFGEQPPSNAFLGTPNAAQQTHPLRVGQCRSCAMVQLLSPMPPAQIKPRFEWITYNEPEGHLDDLAARLAGLPGLTKEARILGLTYKDDSTLRRLNDKGFTNTYRYAVESDLGITDPRAGLETIQATYSDPAKISELAEKHGQADLLSVRHILEHAHDPRAFIAAIRALVKPDGYLWFEMPDCSKFMKACDYTFIWEEHITYFSEEILKIFAKNADLKALDIFVYPYQFEDSLIGIMQNAPNESANETNVKSLLDEGAHFAAQFEKTREAIKTKLQAYKETGKKIAVFGAGHLAAKFINFYDLADIIECVIDDHPGKQGLFMPGAGVPIIGSPALKDIGVCLLSLNSESEKKVRANNQAYLDQGGRFYSIFADNHHSIHSADML